VRNRVIARTFKELGYIEQWGSGITRMLDEARAAGLPPPTFEEIGGRFRVTLWATAGGEPQLTPDQQRLLDALARVGRAGLTTSDLAGAVGRSTRTVRTHMTRLVELGLVVEVGSGPTDPRRRYVRI
jgi:predicted HTH transcriptional regulator